MAEDKQAGNLYVEIQSGTQGASKSLTNIIKKLETLQKTLKGIDTTNLSKMTRKLNSASSGRGSSRSTKSSGGAFGFLNIASWGASVYMARRLGKAISTIAQAGADYTETLNLWETSMGSNLSVATEFVDKMNEAYGISEKTLMNAQAIFKNMLGSLGQISDTMAYQLSEGITQMALDYASLYNVTFEQAFTKFQAALAGQVRPIRSVSGMDITENTLFQLYQQLGGTKTMRQLTRTEKQLLSIYAIFNQMDKSGAIGDLSKTMDSFANQSRVMAEGWQRVASYSGTIVTHLIAESGIMKNINAYLIFFADVLKEVAESTGAIQHFPVIFDDTANSLANANDEMDKLQGKLLSFDKFNALNQSQDSNVFGLDKNLSNALAGFNSYLDKATTGTEEIVKNLKIASGLFNEDGTFNIERWEQIVDGIESFGNALLAIVSSKILFKFAAGIAAIKLSSLSLQKILLTGVIYAILEAIDAFRDGDYVTSALALTIGVTLVGAIFAVKGAVIEGKLYLDLFGQTVNGTMLQITMAVAMLGGGIIALISNWDKLGSTAKVLIPTLSVLAGVITALATGFTIMKGNWAGAISIGAMVTGAGLMVGSTLAVQNYANGGLPDKGTVFRAGEAGAEIVYNTPSGQSGVANIKQIEQAMYGALVRYGNSNGGADQRTVVKIGEDEVFNAVTKSAKRRGLSFTKV